LKLSFSHERQPGAESYRSRVQGRTDHEIALGFLHHVSGIPATRAEQDLLHEGLESVRTQAAAREAN
jgi:exonuclease SbcD